MKETGFPLSIVGLTAWLLTAAAIAAPDERKAPPPGIDVPPLTRAELERGAAMLGDEIENLRAFTPSSRGLLPDVEIFHKAVAWALNYDEFYRTNEFDLARQLLRQGMERAQALRAGQAPWLVATGLVVRGYRSRIDASVQPYGLVVPTSWHQGAGHRFRLDVWLHGRDNHLTELKFLADRERSPGEFAPADAIVLHPYGRYCNAFKFAGEVDVLEALEHVRGSYPIDARRIGLRGFSMGGAGCWHLAVHFPTLWAAASPGAGFAETAEYTGILSRDPLLPWHQQRLWRLYDATDYAANLFNLPVIAYNGELDKQRQAADVMERAMQNEGLKLTRLIGPRTEHRYEPETKKVLARQFDELVTNGRSPWPEKLRFTTWTLRYNRAAWLRIDRLEQHWERARVDAEVIDRSTLVLTTTNVAAFTLDLVGSPFESGREAHLRVDGQLLKCSAPGKGGSWLVPLVKTVSGWKSRLPSSKRFKSPGRQGPVDDAFMDSFIMVRPTGRPWTEAIGVWTTNELADATKDWRAQFRGDARVKDDVAVTDADIAENNLVLWGDPGSNQLLARIVRKLPLHWTRDTLRLGDRHFGAARHIPVLICPNPLNPRRYVVLNSGFTFSDFGDASNALQTPKLPDYAVIDINVPRALRLAKGVVDAGFFDEQWK